MLAFPLHMGIMTDGSFPFPAIGTVHVGNSITQHRPVSPQEKLDVSASAANLRPHPKCGQGLRPGHHGDLGRGDRVGVDLGLPARGQEGRVRQARGASRSTWWPAPGSSGSCRNLGREYAAVSGDHNPIHLYPLSAKAFGFKRQIAHGMWTKARSVAAFANRLPDHARVEVEFKKPVYLPGTVAFGSRVVDDGLDFSLTSPGSGAPHLVGRARRAEITGSYRA